MIVDDRKKEEKVAKAAENATGAGGAANGFCIGEECQHAIQKDAFVTANSREPVWEHVTFGYLMSVGPHGNNQKVHYDYHEEAHRSVEKEGEEGDLPPLVKEPPSAL